MSSIMEKIKGKKKETTPISSPTPVVPSSPLGTPAPLPPASSSLSPEVPARASSAVDADIIMGGGGLSGLAAARRVKELGFSVLVFEAQDRLGGKMHSERLERDTFDFGGCFFDAHTHVNLTKLITTLNVPSTHIFDRGLNVLQFDNGERHRYDPRAAPIASNGIVSGLEASFAVSKIEDNAKTLNLEAPQHTQHGALWDAQSWSTFQNNFNTYPIIASLSTAIRIQSGAEPCELSLLHVLHSVRANRG